MSTSSRSALFSIRRESGADIDPPGLQVAAALKKEVECSGGVDLLKRKLLANLFLEPSTRWGSSLPFATPASGSPFR